jgi:hypothetical protein
MAMQLLKKKPWILKEVLSSDYKKFDSHFEITSNRCNTAQIINPTPMSSVRILLFPEADIHCFVSDGFHIIKAYIKDIKGKFHDSVLLLNGYLINIISFTFVIENGIISMNIKHLEVAGGSVCRSVGNPQDINETFEFVEKLNFLMKDNNANVSSYSHEDMAGIRFLADVCSPSTITTLISQNPSGEGIIGDSDRGFFEIPKKQQESLDQIEDLFNDGWKPHSYSYPYFPQSLVTLNILGFDVHFNVDNEFCTKRILNDKCSVPASETKNLNSQEICLGDLDSLNIEDNFIHKIHSNNSTSSSPRKKGL